MKYETQRYWPRYLSFFVWCLMKCYICRTKIQTENILTFVSGTDTITYSLCKMCFNNMKSGIEICRENCSPVKLQSHVSVLQSQNDSALMDSLSEINKQREDMQKDD